jgi:hypothetical protein
MINQKCIFSNMLNKGIYIRVFCWLITKAENCGYSFRSNLAELFAVILFDVVLIHSGLNHQPPSIAEVKERSKQQLYPSSLPLRYVTGWTSPCINSCQKHLANVRTKVKETTIEHSKWSYALRRGRTEYLCIVSMRTAKHQQRC